MGTGRFSNYFAYGSNLHPERLRQRIGDCPDGALAFLHGARLTFAKRGLDGSGKCSLEFTGSPDDQVIGVVYPVAAEQKQKLEDWEADTCGYDTITLSVTCASQTVEAFTFQARQDATDSSLLPFDWYKRFVVLGALHFNFPQQYVRMLQKRPSLPGDEGF